MKKTAISKGIFERVSEMNEAFGNPKGDPKNIDWDRLERQCKNILVEFERELMPAIAERNLEEVRDALCDINVFSLGAHHFMGIDADADMHAVIDGVLTRFIKDERDLAATMKKYDDLGVDYYLEGTFPTACLKSLEDQVDKYGESYPKGKFLKSVSYALTVFPAV